MASNSTIDFYYEETERLTKELQDAAKIITTLCLAVHKSEPVRAAAIGWLEKRSLISEEQIEKLR